MNMQDAPDTITALALFDRIAAAPPAVPPAWTARPLVLYGAGKLGTMSAQILAGLGLPVAYAIDRHPPADGLLDARIPVHHPDAVPPAERASHALAICVVTGAYTPIRDALRSDGWQDIHPVYDLIAAHSARCGMNNGWSAGTLDEADRAGIAQVLAGWHDDASRAAHLQCLAWRTLREEWTFDAAPVHIDNRYRIAELRAALRADERILDGGAWQGEALEALIALCGGRFESALAVEPDPVNLAALNAWHARRPADQRARIRVHACALGNIDGTQRFDAGMGMASRLRDNGGSTVAVYRIDALGESPSLIKLHLEGHELPALRGAQRTLERCRPLLAVTTYHNRDGLWRTPAWLMDHLPDYRFLMRMHGWCGTGAVVYGIPAERWPR